MFKARKEKRRAKKIALDDLIMTRQDIYEVYQITEDICGHIEILGQTDPTAGWPWQPRMLREDNEDG